MPLPRRVEDAQLQATQNYFHQLGVYANDAARTRRGQRLVARYKKYPWLAPGIATAYTKWEEAVGTKAARRMANEAYRSLNESGATDKSVQKDLEAFVARKDFERQVAKHDVPKALAQIEDPIARKRVRELYKSGEYSAGQVHETVKNLHSSIFDDVGKFLAPGNRALFGEGQTPIGEASIPGLGAINTAAKGVIRGGFTALESGMQEVQAYTSAVATGAPGATNDYLGIGEATANAADVDVGAYQPGASTGAVALGRLFSGQDAGLGSGFFPGVDSPAGREHIRRMRAIATIDYDGQDHFATPGRIFAATVTEPGTTPFNALSGIVDATTYLADPANLVLARIGTVNRERKLFAAPTAEELAARAERKLAPTELHEIMRGQVAYDPSFISKDPEDAYQFLSRLEDTYGPDLANNVARDIRVGQALTATPKSAVREAGGFTGFYRAWADQPTATQFLDNPKTGGAFLRSVTYDFGPEDLAELGRRTKWSLPAETYVALTESSDEVLNRRILEDVLGIATPAQPTVRGFGAEIRSNFTKTRFFSDMPAQRGSFNQLDGPNGALKQLHNHAIGLKLTDAEISTELANIVKNRDLGGRAQALSSLMRMERVGLRRMGMPDDIAEGLTRWTADDLGDKARKYLDQEIATGASPDAISIADNVYPIDKPFLLSEHLGPNFVLPSIKERNAALARYGRVLGIPGTGAAEADLARYTGSEVARSTELAGHVGRGVKRAISASNTFGIHLQNTIWKPFALLRGAWTVRVVGEGQIRIGAAGLDNMFTSPIDTIAWLTSKKNGIHDELLGYASDNRAMRDATKAVFGLPEERTKLIARQTDTMTPVDEGYARFWADKLMIYHHDPIESAVARHSIDGQSVALKAKVRNGYLDDEFERLRKDPELHGHYDFGTADGRVQYIDDALERLKYYTSEDPDIMKVVATGEYLPTPQIIAQGNSLKGRRITYDDMVGEVVEHRSRAPRARVLFDGHGEPLTVDVTDMTFEASEARKVLTKADDQINVDKDFQQYLKGVPDEVKPTKISGISGRTEKVDAAKFDPAINFLFSVLMDVPETALNRSTAYLQYYWQRQERLMGWMSPAARAQTMREAKAAEIPLKAQLRLERAAKRSNIVDDSGLSWDEAHNLAKAQGLDDMRGLLYDLHRRNRGLQALQLFFPFGEAWKEVLGTWARLSVERPQTLRKLQIGVTAARESNPLAMLPGAVPEPFQDQGFLFKDPARDGAEMFVYPWSGWANEMNPLIGVPIPMFGGAQGLNIAFNLIPGVGPAVQIPATMFMDRFMDEPQYDWIRQAISPYGTPSDSEGILSVLTAAVAPAWMEKMVNATVDPDLNTYSGKRLNSIISDIVSYRNSVGEADLSTKEGIAKAFEEAEPAARWLLIMQGSLQFAGPTAPTPEFLAKDKNGKLVRMSYLRNALGELYKKDPDSAIKKFIARFGEDAIYATAPKTLGTVFGQEYTQKHLDWERTHKDIAHDYPTTYPLFGPPASEDDEYSYDAYARSVEKSERTPITGEEIHERMNNILGSRWYDQVQTNMGLGPNDTPNEDERKILAEARQQIADNYYGWRKYTSSKTAVPDAIDELLRAAGDRRLLKSNKALVMDLRHYFNDRQWALEQVEAYDGTNDPLRPGYASGQKWKPLRDFLRTRAQTLGRDNPAFMALWEDTFAREMSDD